MTADLERLMAVVEGATQTGHCGESMMERQDRTAGLTAFSTTFNPVQVRALLTELSALRESEARMREALADARDDLSAAYQRSGHQDDLIAQHIADAALTPKEGR